MIRESISARLRRIEKRAQRHVRQKAKQCQPVPPGHKRRPFRPVRHPDDPVWIEARILQVGEGEVTTPECYEWHPHGNWDSWEECWASLDRWVADPDIQIVRYQRTKSGYITYYRSGRINEVRERQDSYWIESPEVERID